MKHGSHKIRGIDILFEDDYLIVIDKACGILTEETRKGESFTAENAINNYIRKGQALSRKRVWLVHRLDRETSGVLMFAKSQELREQLQSVWHEQVRKTYLAIVCGRPAQDKGVLSGYLYEDRNLFVHQVPSAEAVPPDCVGKYAETEYETLGTNKFASLLKVRLHTGRKNQIRVQMAAIGCPVLGDDKYGRNARPFRERMCLHALSISFPHPVTRKAMTIETETPAVFTRMFPAAAIRPRGKTI